MRSQLDEVRKGMIVSQSKEGGTTRLLDTIDDAGKTSVEAVRKFVDTVNGIFPDLAKDGPRRKVIDSAFKMTEQFVSISTGLAKNILEVTEKEVREVDKKLTSSTK
jgi:hypothetical protein